MQVNKLITLLITCLMIVCCTSSVSADTDDLSNYNVLGYIEATGSQYINTGVSPNDYRNQLIIEAEMSYTAVPSGSGQSYLFGTGYYASTQSNRRNIVVGYRGDTSRTLFTFLNGGQLGDATTISGANLDTLRHSFKIDQVNSLYWFDDTSKSFTGTMSSSVTAPLLIFAARSTGSNTNVNYYSSARLYSFKIYANDVLIRDFIPVERKSDSAVGLYDQANNQFYTNSGSGNFIAGYNTFTITTNVSPGGSGAVTGGGNYNYGQTVTLTAIPNSGYTFDSWSNGSTQNPLSFTAVESLNITANFTASPVYYQITTSVDPLGSGTVTGAGQYLSGSEATLEAIPNVGYVFQRWSDGITTNPRSVTVSAAASYTAIFEEEQSEYEVILSVFPEEAGTTEGSGTYEKGTTIQIQAIPEEGFTFVSWSDGNISNPRTITVNSTIELSANFKQDIEPIPFDEDSIHLIILLLSFLVLIGLGRGIAYD